MFKTYARAWCLFMAAGCAFADDYTFTTLNDRGGGGIAAAINDAGQIAGNSSLGGFVYSNGAFTYQNPAGAFYATGINNQGVVVGNWLTNLGAIIDNGAVATFSVPGSERTLVSQINDSGIVVGNYTTNSPNSGSIYTYDGTSFTAFVLPTHTVSAAPVGIDNSGQIAGDYITSVNSFVPFFYDGTTFHTLTCPDTTSPVLTGMNNAGFVFGWCNVQTRPTPSISYFVYKDGVYSTIDAPGPVSGMNASGVIVGAMSVNPTPSIPGFIGTPVALQFVPISPCRVVDTRLADGPLGGPELAAGTERDFALPSGACGIPANASAYSLNVTAVPDDGLGFLSIWAAGKTQPTVSTLNSDGRVKANAAIVPAGTNGEVAVYVSDSSQLILDINGYFVAGDTAALQFYPSPPCRVADTRQANGPLGGPYLQGSVERAFPILSSACNVPSNAQAYSLNVTAIPHSGLSFLSAYPTGQARPLVSTLNADTGAVTANAAIVPAGVNGAVSLYASNDSDIAIDVNGYFAPPAAGGLSLYTVAPCRLRDTRTGAGAFSGTLQVTAVSTACVPASTAQAVVLNATVVPASGLSYLSIWPTGESQPVVSTLNAPDGAITSNMAIVPAASGSLNFYSTNSTQLILDFSAYFAP